MIVRAPGKLVLVGEYAVLDGAPAIVAAVDRGVQVTHVAAGFQPAAVVPDGDARFAQAALEAVGAPPGRYVFSDWNPAPTATKAGFGGSAAATVAGVYIGMSLRRAGSPPPRDPGPPPRDPGPPPREDVHRVAAEVHHRVQGSGSGIDVAAAAYGGVLRFQAGAVRPIEVALRLQCVWSGQSAKTGPRVAAYLAWSGREGFVAASAALAEAFPSDPIAALRVARARLAEMAAQAGVDWATPALDRIAALAEARGGAAKPSGAGGGDVAVALLPDPDADASFLAACAREGLLPVPVAIAPGVRAVAPEETP